jgi:hypothetical protein
VSAPASLPWIAKAPLLVVGTAAIAPMCLSSRSTPYLINT